MRMTASAETPNAAERDRLVMEHISLVKSVAARLTQRLPAQVEISELISVGIVGLIDAAGRYKASLGVPFDAFARRRVHGAMLDALRQLDWAPRSVRKLRRDVDRALGKLRHELKREPTETEIARELNVSETEYFRMLDQFKAVDLGAVRQIEGTAETSFIDLAIDPDDGPHARLERAELQQHLAKALVELPARERQILSLYYEHELTLAEIGAVLGVGESRVSQLRTQAIARLRSRLRETLQRTDIG
jgi:RNA polymerase sigma factor for flagellar operon FliA